MGVEDAAGSVESGSEDELFHEESALNGVSTFINISNGSIQSILLTCRRFSVLGAEFMFHCLLFDHPHKFTTLCTTLPYTTAKVKSGTASASLGWWTRRFHLTRFYANASTTMDDLRDHLLSLIKQCPNLEIFIIDWSMGPTFGPVADALATTCASKLRTISWHIPCEALPKVIWALHSLPNLVVANLEFDVPSPQLSDAEEYLKLGTASTLPMTLSHLQQLCISGHIMDFLESAASWSLPALLSLSLDFGFAQSLEGDILAFLRTHGSTLLFLDTYSIPPLDVASILSLCPLLQTFTFDADWRFEPPHTHLDILGHGTIDEMSTLVHQAHLNIRAIGLHGLRHAFGVSKTGVDPIRQIVTLRSNELNILACNTTFFPNLRCVRVLDRMLLRDLKEHGGPAAVVDDTDGEGGIGIGLAREPGLRRWERWYDRFAAMGVRWEDCTGGELGVLPHEEVEESSSEEEEEEEEDDLLFSSDDEDEEVPQHKRELRKLIRECRAFEAEGVSDRRAIKERRRSDRYSAGGRNSLGGNTSFGTEESESESEEEEEEGEEISESDDHPGVRINDGEGPI